MTYEGMNSGVLIVIMSLSALLFALPLRLKWPGMFALQLLAAAWTGWAAVGVLIDDTGVMDLPFFWLMGNEVHLVIDRLSAYFLLVVNITAITGGLYANGYLKPYLASKNSTELSVHFFSFLW